MKKEITNETIETKEENQTTEETTEVTTVEEKTTILTKVGNGLKKHGKKVAVGAAVAALGIVGYALGRKSVLKHADDDVDVSAETEDDDIVMDIDNIDVEI